MIDLLTFVPLLSGLGILFIIAYVCGQRRATAENRAFIIFGSAMLGLVLLEFFIRLPTSVDVDFILTKIAAALFLCMAAAHLQFIYTVVGRRRDAVLRAFYWLTVIGVALIPFVQVHISDAPVGADRKLTIMTILFLPFVLVNGILPGVYSVKLIIQGMHNSTLPAQRRKQLRVLLYGTIAAIAYALLVLGVVPHVLHWHQAYRMSSFGSLIHLSFIFYAVSKYKFLRIDIEHIEEVSMRLFENVNEGIVIMEEDGRPIQSNARAQAILGLSCPTIGRSELECNIDNYDFNGTLDNYRTTSRNSAQKRCLALSQSSVSVSNNLRGKIVFVRDVTEQEEAEDEVRRNRQIESLGILAGGIAHDFNNFLTGIMSGLGFLKNRPIFDSEADEVIGRAQKAAIDAKRLALQLITFSRGGAPVREPLDVSGIIEESVWFALRGSRCTSALSLPKTLDPIHADPAQISQVFHNLTLNAIQAMPQGGTIEISGRNSTMPAGNLLDLAPGDYVEIRLRDQGCGMSQEVAAKAFEPYFSTKPHGNGIGLATVRSIVKRHNGHIAIESAPGQGATFRLLLPASSQRRKSTKTADITATLPPSGKILIMDDEEVIRILLIKLLAQLGFEADAAGSGEEAIECVAACRENGKRYDVAIVDLTVKGGMGGTELASKLLKTEPHFKIIASSGYSDDPVMAEYEKYGFCGILIKPYQMNELKLALASVLSCRHVENYTQNHK